ncbi:MAG TPA: TonB-dependent receptor, partial [Cryomorphaceae bacterium]|nr:TonB-dependent receptor [Cryomorphaceae bacterium]
MKGILYTLLLPLLLTFTVKAQNEPRISGSYTNTPFAEWVKDVEAQSPYHFFYKTELTDTLSVTLTATQNTLPELLDRLFANREFHYAIDGQNRVFITYGWEIQTRLPKGFFNTLETQKPDHTQAPDRDVLVDYFQPDRKQTDEGEGLYEIGVRTNTLKEGNAVLTGRVLNVQSGEPIVGANVFIKNPLIGTSTDPLGYYSLSLPRGRHTLHITNLGMREVERNILLYSNGELDIEMREAVQSLQEVEVSAEKDRNLRRTEMGIEQLDVKTLKQIPSAVGEADVLRAVLTLPGVKSVGEASTGFNVRGGGADQNLILFNDAVVYNPSHLFGFFSSFNPDILKDVQLYKSSIPAEYGGRLSSVLDISSREGNKKKFAGSGGIGLITGRLTLEGPIIKDRTSVMLSGRANYSNWILKLLDNEDFRSSRASFYDLNLGVSHQINKTNDLSLNAYYSSDRFRFRSDTTYNYRNYSASLNWKHIFSDKMYANFSGSYSAYVFGVESEANPVNAYTLDYDIAQTQAKADFSYFLNIRHSLKFGASVLHYNLQPGSYQPNGDQSLVNAETLEQEQALENAIYISDEYAITSSLTLDAGLRYSFFHFLGPQTVYDYAPGQPKSEFTVTDTSFYAANELVKTYHGPEFRMGLRWSLGDHSSLKASYNTLRQYIHLLSNTTAISPTDFWKLSDPNIQPQLGQQLSLGYYHNLFGGQLEASVETYYKTTNNYLDYKSGATLIMNPNIERDVVTTRGRAYGVEFLLKKPSGKLNGWLSYTYSRSLLQVGDPLTNENINDGDWYPSNFDKPHDITFIGNYRFTHRLSFSLNVTYSTGRPITLPIARYNYAGSERVYYSDRNAYRIPDY